MLLNFVLHSMRDKSDKATTPLIKISNMWYTLGV